MAKESVCLIDSSLSQNVIPSCNLSHQTQNIENINSMDNDRSHVWPGKRKFVDMMEANVQTGALSMGHRSVTVMQNYVSSSVPEAEIEAISQLQRPRNVHGESEKREITSGGSPSMVQTQTVPKKINTKKISATYKMILDTGLLKDQRIGYARGEVKKIKQYENEGVIVDGGIQCLCVRCKANENIVSPTMFEDHAGSKNKRPYDNIYLLVTETKLRDLMKNVENNPDNMEKEIMKVITPDSISTNYNTHGGNRKTKKIVSDRKVKECNQCEKEYPVDYGNENQMHALKEFPKRVWFCSTRCRDINFALQNWISEVDRNLPAGRLQKNDEPNITWRLLKGKISSSSNSTGKMINVVVNLFKEQFNNGIVNGKGEDITGLMVYGGKNKRQDFRGMYCAVLMERSEVVSAAIFRVFGEEVAELPLVATMETKKKKGYCKALLSCIEDILVPLKVRTLVLHATPEAKFMWMEKYKFQIVENEQIEHYGDNYPFQWFHKATLLHKSIFIDEASTC